jgi:hypothetical protein
VDGNRAIDHLTSLVVVVKGLAHEVDVFGKRLAAALSGHGIIKQRNGARKRIAIHTLREDVPSCSGAVRASSKDALDCLVGAFVFAGSMK